MKNKKDRKIKRKKNRDSPLHCATRQKDGGESGGARDPLNVLQTFGNGSSSVSMALLASLFSFSPSLGPFSFFIRGKTRKTIVRNKGPTRSRETRFRLGWWNGRKEKNEIRERTRANDRKSNCSSVIQRGRPRFDQHFHLSLWPSVTLSRSTQNRI